MFKGSIRTVFGHSGQFFLTKRRATSSAQDYLIVGHLVYVRLV